MAAVREVSEFASFLTLDPIRSGHPSNQASSTQNQRPVAHPFESLHGCQDDNVHGRRHQPCKVAVKEVSAPMLVRHVAI